jgi:hypothetical protein
MKIVLSLVKVTEEIYVQASGDYESGEESFFAALEISLSSPFASQVNLTKDEASASLIKILRTSMDYFKSHQLEQEIQEADEVTIIFDVLSQDIAKRDFGWTNVDFKALMTHHNILANASTEKQVKSILNELW